VLIELGLLGLTAAFAAVIARAVEGGARARQ
jgi:hypothetical protein